MVGTVTLHDVADRGGEGLDEGGLVVAPGARTSRHADAEHAAQLAVGGQWTGDVRGARAISRSVAVGLPVVGARRVVNDERPQAEEVIAPPRQRIEEGGFDKEGAGRLPRRGPVGEV